VLAELLGPMLSGQLPKGELTPVMAEPAAPAPVTPPIPKPAKPRAASIADFIDEMIAQEKPPERGAQRRAS
jgi:hypothetical protein